MRSFICFSVILCLASAGTLDSTTHEDLRPTISGGSNMDIFKKYRCRVCEDILIDSVDYVDGELVLNKQVAVKICDAFFSKVLHNSFGGIICHTVVQTKLDEIVKQIVSSGVESRIGEQICKSIHFCEN